MLSTHNEFWLHPSGLASAPLKLRSTLKRAQGSLLTLGFACPAILYTCVDRAGSKMPAQITQLSQRCFSKDTAHNKTAECEISTGTLGWESVWCRWGLMLQRRLDLQAHLRCFDKASVAEMFEERTNNIKQNYSCGEELSTSSIILYIVHSTIKTCRHRHLRAFFNLYCNLYDCL